MYSLTKAPESFIQIFTTLCLSHVKEQLTENLICCCENPTSFTLGGELFVHIPNRSIILDGSLIEYGIESKLYEGLN
ncbi:MAG: hypothetical protein ABIS01_07335 [Ferruginibacter sp.]